MLSEKWIQGVVISLSLLLGACGGGGGNDSDNGDSGSSDPVARITSPAGGSVFPESSDISFTGTGLDDEDGILSGTSLEWSSDIDDQLGTGATVSSMLTTGSHTITLKATDSDGAMDTDTITLSVNAAPVIASMEASPVNVNIGMPTTFSWTITDAESDTLTCGLDINGNSTDEYTIDDCANGSQAHTYMQAGNYEIRLTVGDGINVAVQQSVNVTVTDAGTGNASPQIDSFNATPDVPKTGDAVTFSWTVSDADGDTLTCGLDINGDGTDEHTSNDCANGSQAHVYMQTGNYQVRLIVTDNVNAPVQQSLNVTIVDPDISNASPEINSFDATPDTPTTSNSMTFNWNVSDDDTLTCKLDVDADGTDDYTISDCANNTSQAHTYTQTGTHKARLTVEDGTNSPVLMEIDLTVSSAPLVISEFTVNPDPAYSTVETTFYWQVSDPEGDTLTCLLDIDNDGTDDYTINDCANIASQEHTYVSSGDYTARLTIGDGVSTIQITLEVIVKPHLLLDVSVNEPTSKNRRALYTITVSNVSDQPLDNVSVVYTVPMKQLQFNAENDAEPNAAGCGAICSDSMEAFWALGTLAGGESRTISINALVRIVLPGDQIIVPVRVTSSSITEIISVSRAVVVRDSLKSQLAMSVSKDPVVPGERLTFNFDVNTNSNSAVLGNLELRAILPRGVTVNSISDDGVEDAATGDIIWDITNFATGITLRRTVDTTVSTTAIAGQIFAARAELRHERATLSDSSVERVVTVVEKTFPIVLDISATPNPVTDGARLRYEFTIGNISTEPVNNVNVLFRVPPKLQFDAVNDAAPNATGCGATCTDSLEASWPLGMLAGGESRTVVVNAIAGISQGFRADLTTASVRVTATSLGDDIDRLSTVVVVAKPVIGDLDLAKKSGCWACHRIESVIVGPAWADVAVRYKGNADAKTILVDKIKSGGKGNWGQVPMPPYWPRVSDVNIEALADFILNL